MLDTDAKKPKMTRGWETERDQTKLITRAIIRSLCKGSAVGSAVGGDESLIRARAPTSGRRIKIGSQGCGTATKQYGRSTVPMSVLEAIKQGQWDYEPGEVDQRKYDSTVALPGSDEKLAIMAERLSRGLPLWHPRDRRCWDDNDD